MCESEVLATLLTGARVHRALLEIDYVENEGSCEKIAFDNFDIFFIGDYLIMGCDFDIPRMDKVERKANFS